jgi:YbbR domain-containing protein
VLSLAAAIILFCFHQMSTREQRFFSAPLVVESKSDLIPSSSYPRTIRVTLRGDPNAIYPIQDNDIEVYIDLSKYDVPGRYRAPVEYRRKGTAATVEPLEVSVDPIEVSVSLDKKASKFVPLQADIRGSVASGYVLASHSLNPTQVIIDGPEKAMSNVTELSTDAIDLSGRTEDFTATVNILNRDPLIVIRGTGATEFHGVVNRIIPVRNLADVPIRITRLASGLSGELDIRAGRVHLEGKTQADLDDYKPPMDLLSVDCSAITSPGSYTLRVRVAKPVNLTESHSPDEVTILVTSLAPAVAAPEPVAGTSVPAEEPAAKGEKK